MPRLIVVFAGRIRLSSCFMIHRSVIFFHFVLFLYHFGMKFRLYRDLRTSKLSDSNFRSFLLYDHMTLSVARGMEHLEQCNVTCLDTTFSLNNTVFKYQV